MSIKAHTTVVTISGPHSAVFYGIWWSIIIIWPRCKITDSAGNASVSFV